MANSSVTEAADSVIDYPAIYTSFDASSIASQRRYIRLLVLDLVLVVTGAAVKRTRWFIR